MTIYFDMDGTFVNLYGVDNWLDYLINENPFPYENAKPLFNMALFARHLNALKKLGYKIGVISWCSKNSTNDYKTAVINAKIKWIKKHLKSVQFDEIVITDYGTPKQTICKNPNGILFDDEKQNRDNWTGTAYNVNDILNQLKEMIKAA